MNNSVVLEAKVEESFRDRFRIGIDWVIDQQGRIYLLEINTKGYERTHFSPVRHFVDALDKIHQHQLFGDLMPDYTVDRDNFAVFKRKYDDQVVYKVRIGNGGEGVSVMEEPENFTPDFLEQFIIPKTLRCDGKDYAFVVRNYLDVEVSEGNLRLSKSEIFSKVAVYSLQEAESKNQAYKLNTQNYSAIRGPLAREDVAMVEEKTPLAMKTIFQIGMNNQWNPTRVLNTALIYCFPGLEEKICSKLPDEYDEINRFFATKGINATWKWMWGRFDQALESSKYGVDLLLVADSYDYKDDFDSPRIWFNITKKGGEIIHSNGFWKEIFSVGNNVLVMGEQKNRTLLERAWESYQKNRG